MAVLAVSTASLFIRLAQEEAPSLVIAAARMAVAAILIAPVTLSIRWQEVKSLSGRSWLMIIMSGLLLAFHFASWIRSLEMTSVASSVVLVTTAPLWVALVSPFILHDPLTKYVIIGLVIALVGGIIVGLSEMCTVFQWGINCNLPQDFFQTGQYWGTCWHLRGLFFPVAT